MKLGSEFLGLLFLGLLFLLISTFSVAPPVRAATTITLDSSGCSTIGGAWDGGTITCNLAGSYNLTDDLYFPPDTTLTITGSFGNGGHISMDFFGTISNSGTFTNHGAVDTLHGSNDIVNSGTFTNEGTIVGADIRLSNSGTFSNDGTINIGFFANRGTLSNDGTIGTGFIDNSGTISNHVPAVINTGGFTNEASGNIVNYGGLTTDPALSPGPQSGSLSTNKAGGTIDNRGSTHIGCLSPNSGLCSKIENEGGGTIANEGQIDNLGTIANDGTLNNYGQVNNANTFANTGTLTNNVGGVVTNTPGTPSILTNNGAINNYGQFKNSETLTNSGTFTNFGLLDNSLHLDNTGVIVNSGTLENELSALVVSAGSITNSGVVDNSGTFTNVQGTITNTGTIDNLDFGLLQNTGATGAPGRFTNTGSGTITNEAGGTVNNKANGILDNFGTTTNLAYVENAGIINDYGSFVNSDTFLNTGSFTVVASGTLANKHVFLNGGVLSNYGKITNGINATITNYGTIDNSATIDNFGTIGSNGAIIDEVDIVNGQPVLLGVLINECGGQLLQYSASTFSGNPPTSACRVHVNPLISVQVASLSRGTLLGARVYDKASFDVQSSLVPTGTVIFYLYFTGTSPSSCTGTGTQLGAPETVQADGSVPKSDLTPALAAGNYAFQAVYTPGPGEANYSPSTSACVPLTVSKATPGVVTRILNARGSDITGASVVAGTQVHDTEAFSGTVSGLPITGTVTYEFYSNSGCTGSPTTRQIVTVGPDGTVPDSPPQSPGGGSYGYIATYEGDANYSSVGGACEAFIVLPQIITNAQFCSFGGQFKLVYVQNSDSTYQLHSSKPGQFYDNIFYHGTPGTAFSLTIPIPFPFITQGANPIRTSSSAESTSAKCYLPSFDTTKQDVISTAGGQTSASGHPVILLGDYGSGGNLGSSTTEVKVSGTVPPSGLVYVTIHLRYGLIGLTFNKVTSGTSTTGMACTASAPCAEWASRQSVIIGYGQPYQPFTVSSINSFHKDQSSLDS